LYRLSSCRLASGCCKALSSVLSSKHSHLTEVWLNTNNVGDSGVQMLCESLRSPNCKLEKLGLRSCYLSSGCCEPLSSALSVDHSRVTWLELSDNNLEDLGVRLLCEGLRSPNCKLQKLSLLSCSLTSGCCAALSSALSLKHSLMTELELSYNKLEDSGVHLLCEGLREENCKLEKLKLQSCGLTSECCEALSLVLSTEHSHLTELWLSSNNLEDSGFYCGGVFMPPCNFLLVSCGLTSGCCAALSSGLSVEHSSLTELEVGDNKLEDLGVSLLCQGLKNPNCKLKKLCVSEARCRHLRSLFSSIRARFVFRFGAVTFLLLVFVRSVIGASVYCFYPCGLVFVSLLLNYPCGLTSGCCEALSLVLSSKHSSLVEVDLSNNNLEDSGVHQLCEGLRNPNCKLETMEMLVMDVGF
uniref:Uncharacterized protein n=1 Tax=Erpetoichthys calabaricus TaxID=27687 RepID=A0A8C4SMV4_ERPCA